MDDDPANATTVVPFLVGELEDLYDNAPCGYLSVDPQGRIERVNATFLTWTGHDAADLLGQPFQSLLNLLGKVFYETHFTPILQLNGAFNEVALDIVGKSGEVIPVLVNAVDRRDAAGRPLYTRITVFNASDRRRYEHELLTARNALAKANTTLHTLNDELSMTNRWLDGLNRELRAFYDTLPVGIFRAESTGRIVQASRRFCAQLRIERPDDWLTAVAEEDREVTARQIQQAIGLGAPFSHRFRLAGDDLPPRFIEMKAAPIPGLTPHAPPFVGVAEDVTEQVYAEARKQQIDRQAAMSQMTGGLAHNLNNILTVIMGNLELLGDELPDRPRVRSILNASLAASERAAALVSRLLVYSGHSTSRSNGIDLDSTLRGVATALDSAFGYRLVCDLRAPGAVVDLDAIMLREAMQGLFENAAAALPKDGAIHLSTRLEEQPDSAPKAIIAVRDHGVGMDAQTLARAREPFFTTRDVGQGIGLGLSLVDGVARMGGGELRIYSTPGEGTTVEVHLPLGAYTRAR